MNKLRVRLLVLLLLAFAGTACSSSGNASPAESPGTATVAAGKAKLTRNSQSRTLLAEQDLQAGDQITVIGSGLVLIDLAGGRSLELAAGTLEVLSSERVDLGRGSGSLLVAVRSPVQVGLAGARATFEAGTVRFDSGGAMQRVAGYEVDGLRVKSGTQDLEIPRYWQVPVGNEAQLGQARPIQFSPSDAWDRKFLSKALEVDSSIANLVRGLEAQLGGAAPGYLTERLAALGVTAAALEPFAQTPASAQVVALAFAQEWKKQSPAEIEKSFSQALALHIVGASWGLLAQQFDVDGPAFLSRLQLEINSILAPVVSSSGGPSPSGGLRPRPGRGPGSQPTQQPPAGPAPTPPQPVPGPSPGSPSLVPLLPDPLRSIIDELYGVVGDLLPIIE